MGEEVDLWEVFSDCKVPEKYWDDFTELLGFDSRYDSVGIEEGWIKEQRKREERVRKKYGPQINEFLDHIELFPMLGLQHPIGKRILREIPQFHTREFSGEPFYRARNRINGRVFSAEDMLAPPVGVAGEGRYNHPGMSVLYLAESETGAALEIVDNPDESSIVWMQKFQTINIDKILDFNYRLYGVDDPSVPENDFLYAAFLRGVFEHEVEERERQGKPEYLMTRFMTDCARRHGIKGICYNSTRSFTTNLVLFDLGVIPDHVTIVEEPYLFTYEPREAK